MPPPISSTRTPESTPSDVESVMGLDSTPMGGCSHVEGGVVDGHRHNQGEIHTAHACSRWSVPRPRGRSRREGAVDWANLPNREELWPWVFRLVATSPLNRRLPCAAAGCGLAVAVLTGWCRAQSRRDAWHRPPACARLPRAVAVLFKHAIGLALSRWGNERGRLIAALSGVG